MKKNTIKFFNEDCFATMDKMVNKDIKVDVILTSPPYNTGRVSSPKFKERAMKNMEDRYDIYIDNKTDDEYVDWSVDLFNRFDDILVENGTILYNLSYGSENPSLMWLVIAKIISDTDFMVADNIIWKKRTALPNNVSPNKLTRICEYVFVFCRKSEFKTFKANKPKSKVGVNGQQFYGNVYNFIEAKNNDGSNPHNKVTFSSDLCLNLLNLYATEDAKVYDPFMGTGTTALACEMKGLTCLGSELSENQVAYSKERILKYRSEEKS